MFSAAEATSYLATTALLAIPPALLLTETHRGDRIRTCDLSPRRPLLATKSVKLLAPAAGFEIAFSGHGRGAIGKCFFVNQDSRHALLGGGGLPGVVSAESIGEIGTGTDVAPAGFAAAEDVNRKHLLAQNSG